MATVTDSTPSTTKAKVETMDDIANLLAGAEEPEPEVEDQESEEGSTQSDESIEEPTEEVETEEAEPSEEENTWGKALGIEDSKIVIDEDGNLSGFNVKIDGKISTIPTAELITGYQTAKSNTNKSQQLAEQRKEFESVRDHVVNEYTKKLDDVGKLSTFLESSLLKEYQHVNWEELRYSDPAEYAAKVQDYQIRQNEVNKINAAIANERAKEIEALNETTNKAHQEYLKGEVEKVIEKNPTWAKPEVFKKALGEFQTFIEEAYGFTKSDFDAIQDARIFEILKDAKRYREGTKIAAKQVPKIIPKFQKPGTTTKAPKQSKLEILTKQAKNATGTRKRELETSAIAELLMGG
jgi:hypothetical protein